MGHRILYIPKSGNQIYYPKYGLLYNWFAVTDSRKITSSDDWTFLTSTEVAALRTYLGGTTVAGGKMKLNDLTYWNSPNTGATNSAGTNCKGSGFRTTGDFSSLKNAFDAWCYNQSSALNAYGLKLGYNSANITSTADDKNFGKSIFIKSTATGQADGTTGTYTGNDGKIYTTVVINQKWYTSSPIAETRFRNGDIIPWYGADPVNYFTDAEWAALTTPGVCAYNNDMSNVGPGFSFPS